MKKNKKTITPLIILLLGMSSMSFKPNSEPAEKSQGSTINIVIKGMKSDKGSVKIGLYTKADGFPDYDKSYKRGALPSKSGEVSYAFEGIADGEYAIAVFQDENENSELDKNMFGIPKEKYGFSNNKFGKTGPPKYEEVKFSVSNGTAKSLTINLK